MRLFVYGTLLDPDVLRLVAGKHAEDLVPATLTGFARTRVLGASYPMLRRAPGAVTRGALMSGIDRATATALERYEGPDYRKLRVSVETNDGVVRAAEVFIAVPGRLRPDPREWSLEAWQRFEKAIFLQRAFGRTRSPS